MFSMLNEFNLSVQSRYVTVLTAGCSAVKLTSWYQCVLQNKFDCFDPTECVPEVKQTRSKGSHSGPSGAEVKSNWRYIATPPYAFMACTGTTVAFVSCCYV